MPRESTARIGRLLDDTDEYIKARSTSKPRRIRGSNYTIVTASFVLEPLWSNMRYVSSRLFNLDLGGDLLVTLACQRKEKPDGGEVFIEKPAEDPRIFWYATGPLVPKPFSVRLSHVAVAAPGGFQAWGKAIDRELVGALRPAADPANGALR